MPRKRLLQYKPLLFTTTVRNPARLRAFLNVLKDYQGQILSNELAEKISGEVIKRGIYKPNKISKEQKQKIQNKTITDEEIVSILKNNPQKHKEAGFKRGWSSRFDTWFKLAKELGFVFYQVNQKIKFSESGLRLADIDGSHSSVEQQAFMNAFARYHRCNPFRRVLNNNKPLILLLQVIKKLNADPDHNSVGISRYELPLLLYWKNDDAEALYQRIKKLREDCGYNPPKEIIVDICKNEIMESKDIKRNDKTIMGDLPDEFIRKMRLTGLIALRGNGKFVDMNKNEQKNINYILSKYKTSKTFSDEKSYFDYISCPDAKLAPIRTKTIAKKDREHSVIKWTNHYSWGAIKKEMLYLQSGHLSKDDILKYLSDPIRLEFLSALAVKSQFPTVNVIPNYPIDDEGLPTSTAPGTDDTGDIECYEDGDGVLLEVTMSQGTNQTKMEVWPIARHLEKFREQSKNAICYFVAPSIFKDSKRQIKYLENEELLFIFAKTIKEFVAFLETSKKFYTYPP